MRKSYDQANQAISRQANALLLRGNVSASEARALVEGQRNALVMQMRRQLSPWGRIYSELLKSSSSLPTLDQLVARKGSIEAVLTSVGKSRSSVNRFAATVRAAGPAAIIIQISLSGVIISQAAPQDRARVASGPSRIRRGWRCWWRRRSLGRLSCRCRAAVSQLDSAHRRRAWYRRRLSYRRNCRCLWFWGGRGCCR